MVKVLRYGCIGAGGIAEWKHLEGYSKLPGIELTAICDPNLKSAQRLAEKYNIPNVFSDYNEMLEKLELDVVSVCTPNAFHAPASIKAMRMGANVHCEKPVSLNHKEAMEMLAVRNETGKKFMVALNNRFTNEAFFIKKYAEEGHFGEIYHASCGWRRRRGIPGKGGWFTNKSLSGGGPLIDLGVHFLDLTLFFMGYPKPYSVSGTTYSKFSDNKSRNGGSYGGSFEGIYDVEDLAAGFLKLSDNSSVSFEFSWASNIEKDYFYYELLGTMGGASFIDGKLKIYSEILDTCVKIEPDTNYTKQALNEFEHFINCVRNDEEPMASLEQAAELMKVIDGVYKSSELKKEIIFE
ncbi:MAG: Gfo/Idh/MocA family oxidoreductase [Clostridia bacterium]|nr:Gfo/Idh/MocA family oxidoreductase [Clostridia bacterium]